MAFHLICVLLLKLHLKTFQARNNESRWPDSSTTHPSSQSVRIFSKTYKRRRFSFFHLQLTSAHQLFQSTSKARCINTAAKSESHFSRCRIESPYGRTTNSSFASMDEVNFSPTIQSFNCNKFSSSRWLRVRQDRRIQ